MTMSTRPVPTPPKTRAVPVYLESFIEKYGATEVTPEHNNTPGLRLFSAQIPAEDLARDEGVQRPLNDGNVIKMAANFNSLLLGTLTASIRPTKIVVLDGGHRAAAAIYAAYQSPMNCLAFWGLSQEQEAQMFLGTNDSSKVPWADIFRVRVAAGDPIAAALSKILGDYELLTESGRPRMGAVKGLFDLYMVDGTGEAMRRAFDALNSVGLLDSKTQGPLLHAMTLIVQYLGNDPGRQEAFVTHAGKVMTSGNGGFLRFKNYVDTIQKPGESKSQAYLRAIVERYNTGPGKRGALHLDILDDGR